VDTEKVIASGFSGGASASMDIALKYIFPVKNFIALGPDKPEYFSKELCENARQRGTRGVIMEGEETCNNPRLQEMESVFKEVRFPYELIIDKGIGHWYPDDFAEKVDNAITFILNE
jgi:predicted esterase